MSENKTKDIRDKPATSFVVAVPHVDEKDPPYDYVLRLGSKDEVVENMVAGALNGAADGWPNSSGSVLYAANKHTTIAPVVTTIATDTNELTQSGISVTLNPLTHLVQSASFAKDGLQMSYAASGQAAVVTGATMAVTLGAATSIVDGVSLQTVGGGRILSVTGLNAAVNLGGVVNLSNASGTFATVDKTYTIGPEHKTTATKSVELSVGGAAATVFWVELKQIAVMIQSLSASAQIAAVAAGGIPAISLNILKTDADHNIEKIKGSMYGQLAAVGLASGYLLAAELLAITTVIKLRRATAAPFTNKTSFKLADDGSVLLTGGGSVLLKGKTLTLKADEQIDIIVGGSRLAMTNTSISLMAGDAQSSAVYIADGQVSLASGNSGAELTVKPGSVTSAPDINVLPIALPPPPLPPLPSAAAGSLDDLD